MFSEREQKMGEIPLKNNKFANFPSDMVVSYDVRVISELSINQNISKREIPPFP